jgi:hypothetical protein
MPLPEPGHKIYTNLNVMYYVQQPLITNSTELRTTQEATSL